MRRSRTSSSVPRDEALAWARAYMADPNAEWQLSEAGARLLEDPYDYIRYAYGLQRRPCWMIPLKHLGNIGADHLLLVWLHTGMVQTVRFGEATRGAG